MRFLASAHQSEHLRVALEPAAHVDREKEDYVRSGPKSFVQLLLIVLLRGPDVVLDREH